MDKRAKSEQFRKRKNNFFHRGYDIGVACDTEVFILFKRNGRFYTFANTEEVVWPTKEDIVSQICLKKNCSYVLPSQATQPSPLQNSCGLRNKVSDEEECF